MGWRRLQPWYGDCASIWLRTMEGRQNNKDSKGPLNRARTSGFSLTELLVVITILGALSAMAFPWYSEYRGQGDNSKAINDLRVLDNRIRSYQMSNETLPAALSDVPQGNLLDPWGRPYQYLMIEGNPASKTSLRKDKNLVPINSDFDLYSVGPDGNSTPALTAQTSQDDITRANDGRYFGLASNY
jgi:general secretion pathway protein G